MTSLATPAPRKLPVWAMVGACYVTVVRNFGQLVRISWLWLLIMVPVYAVVHWLDWTLATPNGQQEGGLVSQITAVLPLALIIELPFLASIAVAWHRLILRQERVTGALYLRLDRTVWLYVLYSFLFLVLVQGPAVSALSLMAPASSITVTPTGNMDVVFGPVLTLLAVLVLSLAISLFVVPRLSIMLPAVVLGERLSLWQAWRITRANTLRLALATFLCILPAASVFMLPLVPLLLEFWRWEWITGTETRTSYAIGQLINSVGYAVLVIFAVTLLSLAYRHFVGRQETAAETVT